MKIGIDLDDVIFEFVNELRKYLKKENGLEIEFENITSYKFSEIVDLDHDNIDKLIKKMADSGVYLQMSLCEFARDSVYKLAKTNNIYFITSRVYEGDTKKSLEKYFSGLDYNLFFSSNPYVNNSGKNKGEICLDLGIDYMIEDSYEHAINCADAGIKCFLIEKPWNKKREGHENIIRVKNWKEIIKFLEEKDV